MKTVIRTLHCIDDTLCCRCCGKTLNQLFRSAFKVVQQGICNLSPSGFCKKSCLKSVVRANCAKAGRAGVGKAKRRVGIRNGRFMPDPARPDSWKNPQVPLELFVTMLTTKQRGKDSRVSTASEQLGQPNEARPAGSARNEKQKHPEQ